MPPSLMRREGGLPSYPGESSGGSGFRRTAEDKARRRLDEGSLSTHVQGTEHDAGPGLLGDGDGAREERFALDLEGNRFRELEEHRKLERKDAIRRGLIQDPDARVLLSEAIEFRGTCVDMCPAYEREEREYKRHLHPLEMLPGESGRGRVDPAKAVTIYHRPAAGISQPLPSDVRTPETLKRTLNYLFHTVLNLPFESTSTNPAAAASIASIPELTTTEAKNLLGVHGFVRDRSRGIRQDFSFQRSWGNAENVEAHERIARFHILSMYELGKAQERADPSWLKQEAEQLNKTLITLIELYDDQRLEGVSYPNEPEFRAYQLLSHLNDNEVARAILDLPQAIFHHPLLQLAFDFRSLAQRNFDTQKVGRGYNTEISLNFGSRFFKLVCDQRVPYLIACLAHNKFGEVRRAAVRALTKAYARTALPHLMANGQPKGVALQALVGLLGCQDEVEVAEVLRSLDVTLLGEKGEENPEKPVTALVGPQTPFNDNADAPVARAYPEIGHKRSDSTYQEIIDGVARGPPIRPRIISRRAPSAFIPLVAPPTQQSVVPQAIPPSVAQEAPHLTTPPSNTFFPYAALTQSKEDHPSRSEVPLVRTTTGLSTPAPRQRVHSPSPLSAPPVQAFPTFTTTTPRSVPPSRAPASRPTTTTTIPFIPTKPPSSSGLRVSQRKSSSRKKPSAAQVDAISSSIAIGLIGKLLDTEVSMVIQQSLSEEAELDAAKRSLVVHHLSAAIAADAERSYLKQTFADMFQDVRMVQVQALCFRHWLRTSKQRMEVKEQLTRQRMAREAAFRVDAERMHLGASTMSSQLGNSTAVHAISGLVPEDQRDDEDIKATLAEIAKRKAILEPGTFWSVLGTHVMQIPSEDEPVHEEEHDDNDDDEVDLSVAMAVSESSPGHWLRRKLNLERALRYTAHFEVKHARRGHVTIVDADFETEELDDTTCLVVFECPADITPEDRQRFQRVMTRLPSRKRFRINLLVVTWRTISLEEFWREIGLGDRVNPFWNVRIQDMSTDATDEAFAGAMREVMATLSYNPMVKFSVDDLVQLLRPDWEALCAFAQTIVARDREDFEVIGKIAWGLVGGLEQVERALTRALEAIGVPTRGIGPLKFADMPSGSASWNDASATRSSLGKLVEAQHDSEIGASLDAVAPGIRHRLEQYFDDPSEIILPLIQELSKPIFTHCSAQTGWIYAESIPAAEVVARRAKEEFAAWCEGCRLTMAGLGEARRRSGIKAPDSVSDGKIAGGPLRTSPQAGSPAPHGRMETPVEPTPPVIGPSDHQDPLKGKKRTFSAVSANGSHEFGYEGDIGKRSHVAPAVGKASGTFMNGKGKQGLSRVEGLAKAIADARQALGR